jgi:glycosyltransferase involved in cell wall biosynthesis
MRICYLADGRYIHTRRWMSFFKNRGHEMHLVSFHPLEPEQVREFESLGVVYHGQVGAFHLKRFWLTARDLSWLARLLRRERMDVLHCHFLGASAWLGALSRFRPLVLTVMGGGDVRGPGWRPQGLRERVLTPHTLRRADLITSWSKVMAEAVRPFCRPDTPIEVIHGGVDLERFHPGPDSSHLRERLCLPAGARVVFSPRLMRPLSNITQIAAAAELVSREEPDVYFVFAAPAAEWEEEYEAEVRGALGAAAERARFVRGIPHDEMADYHRLADVTVSVPSTDGTPLTVLESMACGTPVVAGDIPDYDVRYFEPGESVLAVKPGDAHALAGALLRLLREPALAEALSAEARRRVESTGSYEAQMSRMEQLYRGLV